MKPIAEEMEAAVLGLAMQDPKASVGMLSELTINDFAEPRHRVIFEGIKTLFNEGKEVNSVTVRMYLKETSQLNKVDGEHLTDRLVEAGRSVNAEGILQACRYLKEYTTRRAFMHLCHNYWQKAQDRANANSDLFSKAGAEFFALLSKGRTNRESDSTESIIDAVTTVQQPFDDSERIYIGNDVDQIIKGFQPGELVIVAGKTSHGKSAFTQNLMVNCAKHHGHVALFTLEMTKQEVNERVLAMESGVPLEVITERTLNDQESEQLEKTGSRIKNFPYSYTIVDDGGITIERLYASARRIKLQKDTKLIIVDYLQKVNAQANTREQEVAKISGMLKEIAMELEIVVIGLSQFNRQASSGYSDRPQLHQLRESGAIEQDANKALILWNPTVDGITHFKTGSAEGRWAGKPTRNVVEVHVAKNRGGRTGRAKVGFDGSKQRFYNLNQ